MNRRIVLKLISVSAAVIILTGCGNSEGNGGPSSEEMDSLEPIEVEINMAEKAEAREEIEIGAYVTQAEQPVTDAREVSFEIWKEGEKKDSEQILVEEPVEDKYSIAYTFDEEGVFHVTAHVTARNMHRMPTEEITIGQAGENEEK